MRTGGGDLLCGLEKRHWEVDKRGATPVSSICCERLILLIRCNVEDPSYIQRSPRPRISLISSMPKSNNQGPLDPGKYFLDDLIAEEKSLWNGDVKTIYHTNRWLGYLSRDSIDPPLPELWVSTDSSIYIKQEMAEVGSTFSIPSCFLASDREQSPKALVEAGQEGHRGHRG